MTVGEKVVTTADVAADLIRQFEPSTVRRLFNKIVQSDESNFKSSGQVSTVNLPGVGKIKMIRSTRI